MADPHIADLESRLASVERELADARLAVQARDDFLAIAAHELRTPMNSLGLQLATLERLVRAEPPDMAALAGGVSRARRAVADFVDRAGLLLDATSALADNLIRVRLDDHGTRIRRFLSICKMRTCTYDQRIFEAALTRGGLELAPMEPGGTGPLQP